MDHDLQADSGMPVTGPISRRFALMLVCAVTLIGASIGVVLLVLNWPFTRQRLIDVLQESSERSVTIDRFRRTYWPPGCVAERVSFLRRKHKEKPPLITIEKLTVTGSYLGLIGSPKRLVEVRLAGMHVTVPPRNPDGTNPIMPLTDVKSSKPLVISAVVADGAVLDFMSGQHKEAVQLAIDKLALSNVGNNRQIGFQATIRISEPPGEIRASGRLGPWMADDPGRTPVTGSYAFDRADLGIFKGISGILMSRGEFSGTLDHIDANGRADVGNFHLTHTSHTAALNSEFRASVDAKNGDVTLDRVDSKIRRTTFVSTGSVAGVEGEKGKTVRVEVVSNGRVEDLLDLVISAKTPPITGNVNLRAKVLVPPRRGAFLQKLVLDGDFGVGSGKFTSRDTQGTLNKLSMSSRRELEDHDLPETALSNLRGHVSARNGIATLTNVSFSIRGASAKIAGTYDLQTMNVNLRGVLKTDGKIYVAAQGVKSLLLRAMTPFLKHQAHATIVPFKVTGRYPDATLSLDLFSKK